MAANLLGSAALTSWQSMAEEHESLLLALAHSSIECEDGVLLNAPSTDYQRFLWEWRLLVKYRIIFALWQCGFMDFLQSKTMVHTTAFWRPHFCSSLT